MGRIKISITSLYLFKKNEKMKKKKLLQSDSVMTDEGWVFVGGKLIFIGFSFYEKNFC